MIRLENPPSRFERHWVEYCGEAPRVGLELYEDQSQKILSENESPDLPFRFSLNAYRGCFHGCSYCYARPSHEYLGFGAGTDFERRILVKPRAASLLRSAFDHPSWKGELVLMSGNTDAYQLVEATQRLTRACLEIFLEYRNPLHIITKSPLIERDLDLLAEIARATELGVSISLPFLDPVTARALEPYAAAPSRRLETIRRLVNVGVSVSVNVAPVVPGLSDRDVPRVLQAVRDAGATRVGMILLRLPGPVAHVFDERLKSELPLARERILARTREVRNGRLNDARFGARMHGEGRYADSIWQLFRTSAARLGLEVEDGGARLPGATRFRRPHDRGGQLRLFD